MFAGPWFLMGFLGLSAATIPVVLHLFFRSRYRTVPWAAMKFLLESIKQTRRRLQFQEYILLLARILLLLLLALAFTRPLNIDLLGLGSIVLSLLLTIVCLTWVLCPLWQRSSSRAGNFMLYLAGQAVLLAVVCPLVWFLIVMLVSSPTAKASGSKDPVDAVFIMDVSYSMAARDGTLPATEIKPGDTYLRALKGFVERRKAARDNRGGSKEDNDDGIIPDNTLIRLDRAKAAALTLMKQLPPHSSVQIIAASDRATLIGPRAGSRLEEAEPLIRELEIQHTATDFLPAMIESLKVLKRGFSPNKEVYLFSDMQTSGWTTNRQGLVRTLQEIKRLPATLFLVHCGSRTPRNAALVDITTPKVPHRGERTEFSVRVRNTGVEMIKNLTISLRAEGDDEAGGSQQIQSVRPGETRTVSIPLMLNRPGLTILRADLKGDDDLHADNQFNQVIHVREQLRVLVVDGAPHAQDPKEAASFPLQHALAPVLESRLPEYFIQPYVVSAAQATPDMLASHDVCILVNCAVEAKNNDDEFLNPTFLDRLSSYVRDDGRGLLIFCGDRVQVDTYNRLLDGLLPAKLLGIEQFKVKLIEEEGRKGKVEGTDVHFSHESVPIQEPAFQRIRKDELYKKGFGRVNIRQIVRVEDPQSGESEAQRAGSQLSALVPPPGGHQEAKREKRKTDLSRVILRYTNGLPAVLSRKVGNGEVLLVTTSADKSWNDWPTAHGKMYVPFMDFALVHLLSTQTQSHNLTAGTQLRCVIPEKANLADVLASDPSSAAEGLGRRGRPRYFLKPPGRERVILNPPQMSAGRAVLTAEDTVRAGVYRIMFEDVAGTERQRQFERAGSASDDYNEPGRQRQEAADVPFAVVPDFRESNDLSSLASDKIDEIAGSDPCTVHIIAGNDSSIFITGERLHSEWTRLVLLGVLLLAVSESLFAWFCGRAR